MSATPSALRPAAQSLLPSPKRSLGSAQAGRVTGRTTSGGGGPGLQRSGGRKQTLGL